MHPCKCPHLYHAWINCILDKHTYTHRKGTHTFTSRGKTACVGKCFRCCDVSELNTLCRRTSREKLAHAARACVRACVRTCVRTCVRAYMRACVRACVCTCVRVLGEILADATETQTLTQTQTHTHIQSNNTAQKYRHTLTYNQSTQKVQMRRPIAGSNTKLHLPYTPPPFSPHRHTHTKSLDQHSLNEVAYGRVRTHKHLRQPLPLIFGPSDVLEEAPPSQLGAFYNSCLPRARNCGRREREKVTEKERAKVSKRVSERASSRASEQASKRLRERERAMRVRVCLRARACQLRM